MKSILAAASLASLMLVSSNALATEAVNYSDNLVIVNEDGLSPESKFYFIGYFGPLLNQLPNSIPTNLLWAKYCSETGKWPNGKPCRP